MNPFAKSFRLAYNNSALALSSILIQLMAFALVVALLALAVFPVFSAFVDVLSEFEITTNIEEFIEILTKEEFDYEKVSDAIAKIIDKIVEMFNAAQGRFSSIIWAYAAVLLISVLFRFAQSLVDVPVACSLNEFMLTCQNRRYIWYFIKKLRHSAEFSFFQLSLTMVLDLFVISGAVGLYIIVLAPLGVAGIILGLLNFIVVYSLRFTLTGFWLIEYVTNGYKILKSLKDSIKKVLDRFWQMLYQICIVMLVVFSAYVGLYYAARALPQMLRWIVLALTALISYYGYYLVKCISFVQYFEQADKQYYTKRRRFDEKAENHFIVVE